VSKKTGTFEQCIDFFREMGYSDLYHNMTGEEFGKESNAIYYHQFKEDMPFFIDYAFTNMSVKGFVLGDWNKDISDHCPLTILV